VTGASSARELRFSSSLDASPEIVWRHATRPDGVNRELRPLLRMTFPAGLDDLTASWRPGERLFRSWILLGGLLPVEYDDLALVEVEPGRRFLERSSLASQRVWEHERIVEPEGTGCRVTDRIRFVPRIPWLGPLHALAFRMVFRLRHRNLRRTFR
jgi:ligand-binding SRPBCC domain-containing protein